MNKPLILVVEDDPAVARLISTTLETRNYQYHRVQNGAGALLEAASARPDVILLDLGLPDMDGIDVIRKIRGWSNVPILVVSARSDDTDKVSALDAGADDYLTKPFSVEELLARLRVASPYRICVGADALVSVPVSVLVSVVVVPVATEVSVVVNGSSASNVRSLESA